MKFNVRDTLSSDLPYSRAIKGFGENKIEAWEIADATSFDFAVRELFMANQAYFSAFIGDYQSLLGSYINMHLYLPMNFKA